jgi:hypothetical protein
MWAARLLLAIAALVCGLAPAPQAAAKSGGVLVVGDSLEVGTGPYLRRELAGVPLTVDARTSRPSPEGLRVLRARLRPGDQIVVFDLGTNDDPSNPRQLASDLSAARQLVGNRCLVVATVNRPPYAGVSVAGLNRVIQAFVDQTRGAQLVDWRAAVAAQPSLVGRDGVHPNPGGYAVRARLVAQGIQACLESGALRAPRPGKARGASPPRPPPVRRRRASPAASPLARIAPIGVLIGTGRDLAGVLSAAWQAARDGVTPTPPEPVLGRD